MHNRQALTPRRLWQTMKDYDLWPLYFLGLIVFIPQSPPTKYLTLIVKSLGFSTFNTNLLSIPSVSQPNPELVSINEHRGVKLTYDTAQSIGHIITLLAITRLSEYYNERTLIAMIQALWTCEFSAWQDPVLYV